MYHETEAHNAPLYEAHTIINHQNTRYYTTCAYENPLFTTVTADEWAKRWSVE